MPVATKEQNVGGRPSKLNEHFIKIAEEVINHEMNAVVLTDEELLIHINEKLEEKDRICDATWENWKSGKIGDDENAKRFLGLIKKALSKQKKNLFAQLQSDDRAWQRWAWIIERKFDDWNIKQKQEVDNRHSGSVAFINDIPRPGK